MEKITTKYAWFDWRTQLSAPVESIPEAWGGLGESGLAAPRNDLTS